MQNIYSVSVRALAEFALEKGDLSPVMQAAARMQDGVRGHKVLQEMLPWNWRPEFPVSSDVTLDGGVLRIHGRADAAYIGTDSISVLEIKTTTKNPAMIMKYDYPVHWAQAEIYAFLFCRNQGFERAEVRLIYARLDGKKQEYSEEYDFDALEARVISYVRPYLSWISAVEGWKEKSRPTLQNMPFPFDTYREGQRDMAKYVYLAMKRRTQTLIEAPTGIGKTAAALFGALKALGEGHVTAIFYLTARTTGRRAAEDALDRMRARGLTLRSVTITAKEKCCLLERVDCMGCPYASGYYDRRRDALKEAVHMERLDAEAIRDLAVNHDLCPFELSLDISETADVIICDYNYAFDPRVRLKRYFENKSKAGLLVDEAHNLPDRAREMLSAEISGRRLEELRREVGRFEGKDSPMYKAMSRLMQAFTEDDVEMECTADPPGQILDAVSSFVDEAWELQPAEPEVVRFTLEAQWFQSVAKKFDEESYRALILPETVNGGQSRFSVKLWCFDPSKYLRRTFERVGGTALFSATLAPMEYYAGQLSVEAEADTCLRLESPFPRENLAVLRLPVSASFKDRERTLNAVAHVVHAMATAHTGNYIACFPSYAYLNQTYQHYRMLWPQDYVIRQQSEMNEAERLDFIQSFQPHPRSSMVAFVVLGGVFAEGVDLPNDRLSGAAIVSTGIPQPSFEREMLRSLYDDAEEGGYDAAYVYPGMRRVLQAAGRVIRTETDQGVVLLLDTRYRQEKYLALMPEHWRIFDVKSMSTLSQRLENFWKERNGE